MPQERAIRVEARRERVRRSARRWGEGGEGDMGACAWGEGMCGCRAGASGKGG